MKANELMIGDWVIIKGHPCKVSYLAPFDIGDTRLSVISNGYDGNPYIDEIEPITLTAEILEANGFEKCGDTGLMQKIYEDEGVRISANVYYINIYLTSARESRVNLKPRQAYVHELQHALRLCGLDYIADNFKI